MKARVSTILTLLVLVAGSGGALAVASGSGGPGATSAATSQYKPGKHCGKRPRPANCPKPKKHHHGGVLPGSANRGSGGPGSGVAGESQEAGGAAGQGQSGVAAGQSNLPFTGLDLLIVVLAGCLMIGAGLLQRRAARKR